MGANGFKGAMQFFLGRRSQLTDTGKDDNIRCFALSSVDLVMQL